MVNANDVISIGYKSFNNASYSIGMGHLFNQRGIYSVGLGYNASTSATGDYAVLMGATGSITKPYAIGFGYGTSIDGVASIGIGANTAVTSDSSIVIGADGSNSGTNSIGIGSGVNIGSGINNSVAIGANSTVTSNDAAIFGTITSPLRLGIGTTNPNQYAAMDLAETDKGLLMNRMTTVLRTTLGSSLAVTEQGLMVYDTDEDILYTWDGTTWNSSLNTDTQDLTLTGNTLSLTNDGTPVDLSAYLDNTDTQLTETEVDAFVANNGYLTSFVELDGDVTNEIQDLSLAGNTLSLTSDGTPVDLSAYLDNTDTQNLTAATLTGTTLHIEIENGASVSVDLGSLLTGLQTQLNDLEIRVTNLESCACDSTAGVWDNGNGNHEEAILYQNIPNPFNSTSTIKYYIPSYASSANLVISNNMGQIISNIDLHEVGTYGEAHVNADGLAAATYFYTLYVNQTAVATKKMMVE